VSKAWTRLEKRGLVEKGRKNRVASVTLLTEDGTGLDYSRPVADFISIPHSFWLDGPDDHHQWHEVLTLAEIAVLMIAHMNLEKFALPAERAPDYHEISADTFTRGAKKLGAHGLLEIEWSHKTAPTAPAGLSELFQPGRIWPFHWAREGPLARHWMLDLIVDSGVVAVAE